MPSLSAAQKNVIFSVLAALAAFVFATTSITTVQADPVPVTDGGAAATSTAKSGADAFATKQATPPAGSGAPLSMVRKHRFKGAPVPRVAHRRGLAVIADFADSRLEDWQGPGIGSVAALSVQLHQMEDHWAWLSRGQESFQWDIVRITLPTTLRADAYPDWIAYRNAVATLVRQQVEIAGNLARYDANHDGIIDSAWIIASGKDAQYDYLGGGASRNIGVNLFVDGQSSLSVQQGATGNFNHELAHTIGVPDLYGPYDTLHYLTLMSDSWPVPPQDFTAYERSLLGWVTPRLLGRGTHRVRLSTAGRRMDAIRIGTSRDSEYFLIEFRRRPDDGFGSNAPVYNGLAVYHILEGSNQWTDPPLMKLEAADGMIAPNALPEASDFLFPGNPAMKRPLVLRSYFDGQEIFRIHNLQWTGGDGLAFDLRVAPPASAAGVNLLANPSFEQGSASGPDGWQTEAYLPTAQFSWDTRPVKDGRRDDRRSVGIVAPSLNDARWTQTVANLNPQQSYQFCGWLRGKDIDLGLDAITGGNVSVMGGYVLSGSLDRTFDWQQACVAFRPETTSSTLACRLGFYGSTVTGSLSCDRMTLVPLNSGFD